MKTFTEFFCKEGRESADVVLFDIDGTLSFGRRPLPGAEELLDLLNKEKFPYLLLTNDKDTFQNEIVELQNKQVREND